MSDRNMTQVMVDGYRYTVSLAAKKHIYEVLAPYDDTKSQTEAPKEFTTVFPEPPSQQTGGKSQLFGKKKDKKKN